VNRAKGGNLAVIRKVAASRIAAAPNPQIRQSSDGMFVLKEGVNPECADIVMTTVLCHTRDSDHIVLTVGFVAGIDSNVGPNPRPS
jgi:hypothetical protein